MNKYIAYCRKSTDEKDKQVLSIEAQIAELKEFAKRDHLEITEFITEAKTAKIPGREQFALVLKKIEKGEAQGIISWHPDRLARNSIDGGKVIYLLDTGKLLDLKFPSFWFESTPQGKFMLSIAFGQSKYYVDNLSENVKRGNRQKLRRGEWPSKAPYGYINNPKTRAVDVDPELSKVVKKAFQLMAEGNKSFTEISNFMFKFGMKRESCGKPIKVDQIKRMLSNKFYVGILKYANEYYEGSHKCFISKQLFQEVQKQVEKILRPRQHGHDFAFSGLATCGECGAAITAEQHIKKYKNGTNQTFIYYRCTKKLKPCLQKYAPEDEIEQQLKKVVGDCGLHQDWEPYFEKWMARDEITDQANSETELKGLGENQKEIETKLNRLLDGYLDRVVEPEVYKQKKNELFEEKLKVTEQMARISKSGSSWLEPMREFVISALQAQKIARAKNECHDLAIMAKTVGSNYSLFNRQLRPDLKYPFAALSAEGGAASAAPNSASISKMVNLWGNELSKRRLYKQALSFADIVGLDIYLRHPIFLFFNFFNKYIGPLDSQEKIKQIGKEIASTGKEFWLAELQAEPWEVGELNTKKDNPPSFLPEHLLRNFEYGLELQPKVLLLWGFEWWYYRKSLGDARYWNEAQKVVSQSPLFPKLVTRT